jgi:hypothetical protein
MAEVSKDTGRWQPNRPAQESGYIATSWNRQDALRATVLSSWCDRPEHHLSPELTESRALRCERLCQTVLVESNNSLSVNHGDRNAVEPHLLQLVQRDLILAHILFSKGNLPLGKPRFHLVAGPSAGGTVNEHLFHHLCPPP